MIPAVILLGVLLLRLTVLWPVRIQGESMVATYRSGDMVLVLATKDIRRLDTVQCRFADREGTYIKRLIGLPGETVSCSGGVLYIDGRAMSEPYTSGVTEDFSVTLGEDEYWVLGDNRAESYDSRQADMGAIVRGDLLGKVVWTLLPLSRSGPEAGRYAIITEGRAFEMAEEEKRIETQEDITGPEQKKGEKPKLTGKQRFWKEVREWIVSLVVAVAVVLLLRGTLCTIIRVDGMSMYSTLNDNERLFVTVYDAKWGTLERGDVVICNYPGRTNKLLGLVTVKTEFVKRIVAVPGDTVERHAGVTTVTYPDGTKDVLDAGNNIYTYAPDYDAYLLGEDEYFVVGDNRNNSHDSRDWKDQDSSRDVGPISRDMIVGHVRTVIWPLNSIRNVGSFDGSGME